MMSNKSSTMLFLRMKPSICHWAVCSPPVFRLSLSRLFSASAPRIQRLLISCRGSTVPPPALQKPRSTQLSAFQSLPACIGTNRHSQPRSLYERTASTHKQPFVRALEPEKRKAPQSAGLPPRQTHSIRGVCSWVCACWWRTGTWSQVNGETEEKQPLWVGPPVLIMLSIQPTAVPTSTRPVARWVRSAWSNWWARS